MRHALVLALAMGLCPQLARAEDTPPPEERDELIPPALPEVPAALQRAVAGLGATVRLTEECYTAGGRMEHEADARCPQWYAQLARGGAATVFAIGEVLRPVVVFRNEAPVEPLRNSMGDFERGPRLVQLMARTQRPEVVPFFVGYLVRTATHPEALPSVSDAAMLRALREFTGDDPTPTAPWEDDRAHLDSPAARTEIARRWLRWYRDHAGRSVAEWRAEGLERARQRLTSDDLLERYSAIRRLAPLPAHRDAVTASLQELLARDDVPAAARVHLHRLGRQHGLRLPVNARLTSAR